MPIYMKYDGVDGDVTAESHEQWIGIQSVSWGSSRGVSVSGVASDRTQSVVQVREVVITKERDSSSGKLWKEHLGKTGKTVTIDWTITSPGGDVVFQSLQLENVLISSFSQSGHANEKPLEQLSLNFTKIEGTFYDMEDEGVKTSKPFKQSYDLQSAT